MTHQAWATHTPTHTHTHTHPHTHTHTLTHSHTHTHTHTLSLSLSLTVPHPLTFFLFVSPRVFCFEPMADAIGGKRHLSTGGSCDKQLPLALWGFMFPCLSVETGRIENLSVVGMR